LRSTCAPRAAASTWTEARWMRSAGCSAPPILRASERGDWEGITSAATSNPSTSPSRLAYSRISFWGEKPWRRGSSRAQRKCPERADRRGLNQFNSCRKVLRRRLMANENGSVRLLIVNPHRPGRRQLRVLRRRMKQYKLLNRSRREEEQKWTEKQGENG